MKRKIPFCIGETYHIYNRGVEKRIIFESEADYLRMLMLLLLCNSNTQLNIRDLLKDKNIKVITLKQVSKIFNDNKYKTNGDLVDVLAYCLMPNHIHLVLYEKTEGGITTYLRKVMTAYTMYFNKKYDRTGVLFQGTTKSQHIDNDGQYINIFGYVHKNPISLIQSDWKDVGIKNKKTTIQYIENYPYSSYKDYLTENSFTFPILGDEENLPEKSLVTIDIEEL